MSAFENVGIFSFTKVSEGEITMVSVRKRGKVFEYRFEVATVEGTRKWISKSGYPSKAEAFKEGAKAYNDFYYNGNKVQLREKMSYADFLDYWIDTYASFNLHYSTTISYINIIKNHVKPRIGYYQLWQLDTRLLQEFINKIYVEYAFSKNYMASILKVVKGSLKYACYTLNYINTNPAEHVHAPRIDKINNDPAHIFTQEEIEKILERFKGTHSIYYSFLTAYYTGTRVSEVYGLTWDCIDFENKTLTINKNIIKKNQYGLPKRKNITKGHSVGVWYYGDCKNPQSKRTISIGDTLVNALKEYKKEQEENRKFYGDSYLCYYEKKVLNDITKKEETKLIEAKLELGVPLPEAQLVFVKENGQFLGTDSPKYAFKVIHYELGINSRFHDFRDTHATRLIESGADIKAVSKRLGHSTIQTTYNIYVRVTEKMENDTVDKFEEYTNTLDIPKTSNVPYLVG